MTGSRKRFHRFAVPFFLVCLTATLAAGGDFWAKKPYQNWTADEARRIQEESPWATTLTLGGIQSSVTSGDAPNNRGYRGEMETDPSISYTIQFRTALPMREAQVRVSQLNAHYDSMKPEQKAAFDASANKFLAATFPDRVLVAVTFHTNVENYQSLLRNYWASQSLAKLSMTVFLNIKAEKLNLTGYSFKDDTFQFTFPRPKQVQPDEKIGVEFVHPRINAIGEQRVLQDFSIKKMLINGEPAF